jgi:hypothetical protein
MVIGDVMTIVWQITVTYADISNKWPYRRINLLLQRSLSCIINKGHKVILNIYFIAKYTEYGLSLCFSVRRREWLHRHKPLHLYKHFGPLRMLHVVNVACTQEVHHEKPHHVQFFQFLFQFLLYPRATTIVTFWKMEMLSPSHPCQYSRTSIIRASINRASHQYAVPLHFQGKGGVVCG